jgi:hypothetical protein
LSKYILAKMSVNQCLSTKYLGQDVCQPNVCQPNVCQLNVCQPNVYQPNVCQPNVCHPNVYFPNVCQSNIYFWSKMSLHALSVNQMSFSKKYVIQMYKCSIKIPNSQMSKRHCLLAKCLNQVYIS